MNDDCGGANQKLAKLDRLVCSLADRCMLSIDGSPESARLERAWNKAYWLRECYRSRLYGYSGEYAIRQYLSC